MRLKFYANNNSWSRFKQFALLLIIFSCSMFTLPAHAQRVAGGIGLSAALNLNLNLCGPQLSISSNIPSCNGNTVCLAIVGGLPPYKVFVDGQSHSSSLLGLAICIQNLHPGNHIIKVIDLLGCESTLNINIPSINDLLRPVIKPVSCHGGRDGSISINLSLLGGIDISNLICRWEGPNGYQGEGREIHGLQSGRYTVRILTIAGICIGTGSWDVPHPQSDPIKININIANAACSTANACAYISGGKAPYRVWGFYSLPGSGVVTSSNFLDHIQPDTHREEDCTHYNPDTQSGPYCVNNLSAGHYYILVKDANGCYAWQVFKINPSARFQRTVDVKDISCAGEQDGQICFDIVGNTPPYKTTLAKVDGYALHTIEGTWGCFENLQAAEYLLITTDGSDCTSKEKIKIMEPEELEAVFVIEENNCQDGAKGCLKIEGGTRPYKVFAWFYPNGSDSYEIDYQQDGTPYVLNAERCNYFNFPPVWSPTSDFCVRNLPPGKYILLVVDAHHCFEKIVVEVPDFEDLRAKFELTSSSCDEWGSGCLTIEGGSQPYKVFVYSSNSLLTVIPVVRFDGSGRPRLDGCDEADWQWSTPGIAPPYQVCAGDIPPGYYWILIVDKNGCHKLLQVNVPRPNKIHLSARVKNVSCNGEKDGKIFLSINGGQAPYKIQVNGEPVDPNTFGYELVLDSLKAGFYKIDVTDKNGCTTWIEVKIIEPEPLSAVFISDQTDPCDSETGGCVKVQGGTAPYRIRLWQLDDPNDINVTVYFNATTNRFEVEGAFELNISYPSPNNNSWCFNYIPPGDYLILVTDANGCYTVIPIHIDEPNNLRLNAEVFHAACEAVGGKIKLRIKGGEAPYQIKLGDRSLTTNDSIVWLENIPPGTYQIWVYDNRQCNTDIKVIIKTEEIKANLRFDKFGEWACVNPSGGTPPYKIEWTNLEDGSTISNDSCVSNLIPGVYQVIIYDQSGCNVQHWFVIDPQPCDPGVVKLSKEWIHSGESVQFKLVGSDAVRIQWQFRTQFTEWIDIPGATGDNYTTPPLHVAMDEIIYVRAKVKCANGGIAYTEEASFKVRGNPLLRPIDARVAHPQLFNPEFRQAEIITLQYNKVNNNTALVYPTVSRDIIKVRFSETKNEMVRIYVVNSLGAVVYQMQQEEVLVGDEIELPVNQFAPGSYFVRIESGQQVEMQRIMVQ